MDNYTTLVDLIIQAELDGKPLHERILKLGKTPDYLLHHAGFSDLPLVITGSVVGKACFDHGIAKSVLHKLPAIIENSTKLFAPADERHKDSVVVLTAEIKGGYPIIVPIRKNKRMGRTEVFNAVSSVYAKEGPDPAVKWTQEGLLLWSASTAV